MTTGIEVKVTNGNGGYTPWVEKRRNLFQNPRAASLTGFGAATLGTRSTLTGLPGRTPTAYRHTRTTATTAARVADIIIGPGMPRGVGVTVTVQLRIRASAVGNLTIAVRGTISSSTGQSTLGVITVTEANVFQDFVVTGNSITGTAGTSAGVAVIQTGGASGMTVDIQEIDFEEGSGGFYLDPALNTELQRVIWTGAEDASPTALEERTLIPGTEVLKGDTGYSVHEEATSVDPTDTTGAGGSISIDLFNGGSRVAAKRLSRKTMTLTDRGQGVTSGTARVPSGSLTGTSVQLDQRTVALSVERTAQPFTGTLRNYFIYLLGLVGIVDGYVIDPVYSTMTGTFPGWQAEVWLQMKRLLAIKGGEITQASDNIIIRPIRGRITVDRRDKDFSWSMDDSSLALAVEGYWYETTQRTAGLAYPDGGWNDQVQVYTVDAGETIEYDVPINASLSSISQPIAQNYVSREYIGPTSVYSVVGSDGLPVPASQWLEAGGKVEVSIGDDTRSLLIRITGAQIERYAPFRIAASAGPSDNYSSLRLVGTGVFYEKHGPIRLITSATEDDTTVEVGATLDSEFVTNLSDLYDAMAWMLSRYGGPRHTIRVETTGINRSGESGSYAYPTFGDFNEYAADQGWTTFADFNAEYVGFDFGAFNDEWAATVADAFVNQAFGNVAGARTFRDGLWYRLRTTDITPASISYTAENDTTAGDLNTWLTQQFAERGLPNTFESFNTLLAERATFAEFSAAPLSLED
ncbi:MAG: hypothetical protein K0S70_112 [Microbacterium sp.]|nr:hypothetical protein [Microbacterium sp.]